MKLDFHFLWVFVAAVVPAFALSVAVAFERRHRKRTEKPPQQEKLLRPPGYSLALRLDEIQDEFLNRYLVACLLCAVAGACGAMLGVLRSANALGWRKVVAVLAFGIFAVAGAWSALSAFRRLRELRNVRLGLSGERVVAEALQEVAEFGYRSFHDLPGGENWNIDHVVVGTRGVFLIETKARRRRAGRKGQAEHVAEYDGKVLRFPSGDDTKAIPQAQRNASWLVEFLTKRTAEPVTVEALVVLPGWYVEPKGNFSVKVMNATYLTGYLRGQKERIQPVQVQRIVALLDEKCRDVEF